MGRSNSMGLGLLAGALGLFLGGTARAAETPRAAVDVVFVLDTTGSMGGLLEGAKQKIWAIANEIAKGKPAPKIRMGLVAFRDRGDDYVTKTYDLSANLDKTYSDLLALRVGGGGDGPEHVLKGLEDAIETMSWSSDKKTFKVVYLVGDAPPHEDYDDTPKLSAILEKAVRKGLVVNTVQCGSDGSTTAAWQKIAKLAEGKFLAIPHDGGVAVVATPFDERLASLESRLDGTRLAYGRGRAEARAAKALAGSVRGVASAPAAADRAVFMAGAAASEPADRDIVGALESNKVKLEDIKEEELPEQLKAVEKPKRAEELKRLSEERRKVQAEFDAVAKSRQEFLKKNAGAGRKDSFDSMLTESLKTQAGRKGIRY